MGHPLSQTLFTSIYLDKLLWPIPKHFEDTNFGREGRAGYGQIPELVHIVLRAYCLGLIKCCDLVHTRVIGEFYYEVSPYVSLHAGKNTRADSPCESRRKRISAHNSTTGHCYHTLILDFSPQF